MPGQLGEARGGLGRNVSPLLYDDHLGALPVPCLAAQALEGAHGAGTRLYERTTTDMKGGVTRAASP